MRSIPTKSIAQFFRAAFYCSNAAITKLGIMRCTSELQNCFLQSACCRDSSIQDHHHPAYFRQAASMTDTRAACWAAEDTWGLVVTPIWPAMLDCDLPDPDAAAITCWRDECCAAALTLELFAAPRWPATCCRFIFETEKC